MRGFVWGSSPWHGVGCVALTQRGVCALLVLPGTFPGEQGASGAAVLCPRSDFDALNEEDAVRNNQLAFDVAEQEFGIPPVTTGKELGSAGEPDKLSMVLYLSKFYELFRGTPLRAVGEAHGDFGNWHGFWEGGSTAKGLLTAEPFPLAILQELPRA